LRFKSGFTEKKHENLLKKLHFLKGSDEAFLHRTSLNHAKKEVFVKARAKGRSEFGLKHRAGLAFYATDGWLQQNRWTRPAETLALLSRSRESYIAAIFCWLRREEDCGGGGGASDKDKTFYLSEELRRGIKELLALLKRYKYKNK
jgi:myosin heavy subunit